MTRPLIDDGEDEFTEIVDADIARVDLVKSPANGRPFLIAKSAGERGMFEAEFVHDLVRKADLSTVPTADLRRTVVAGSGAERNAALQELGLRAMTGEAEPSAPKPKPKRAPKQDLEPAPKDEVGTPAGAVAEPGPAAGGNNDVTKAIAKSRRRGVLHDPAERQIAARAVARVAAAVRRGDTPAGVALIKAQAATDAARELRDHRATRRA
jgi:hypothetical protein